MKRVMMTAVAIAFCLASCEKDEVTNSVRQIESKQFALTCTGGGDDEDPIIQTGIEDPNGGDLENVNLTLYQYGTSMPYATNTTNTEGEACFRVTPATYYLISAISGFKSDTTDLFAVDGDTSFLRTLYP